MHFLSIIFFTLSSSSDNFIIGLSYAAKKIKINFIINVLVGFITCIGTIIAMLSSKLLFSFISPIYTNILGSLVLILFGIYMLVNAYKEKIIKNELVLCDNTIKECVYSEMLTHPEVIDKNNSKTIEFKEAIILGLVLSINNIGLGIGASLSNLNIYITSIASFIFSVLFIKLGYYIGKISSSKLSNYTEKMSAWIILLLGVYELFIK